ncbi:hypothetical protein Vafri_222 [Volvox africanus]|nr:hypothetical protein Vafri_222 [Volvox africanus]
MAAVGTAGPSETPHIGRQPGTSRSQGQVTGQGLGLPPLPPLPSSSFKYKYTSSLQEDHREPIFCVTFNNFDLAHRDVFVTVGQHRATIYKLLPGGEFELLQVYEDADRGRKTGGTTASAVGSESEVGEKFYCCKWSRDEESGAALLLIGGEKALVRVLDVSRACLVHVSVCRFWSSANVGRNRGRQGVKPFELGESESKINPSSARDAQNSQKAGAQQ